MNNAKWFKIAGIFLELSGLLMVLGVLIPGALDTLVGMLFVPRLDVALDAPARLGSGVGGAILTGWGATMVMIGRELPELSPAAVGRAFMVGAVTWFVLDGVVSVTLGAYLNLPGNLVYLVVMMLPAWGLARGVALAERVAGQTAS